MEKEDIKKYLLTSTYGRFDFLPAIVPKEMLMFSPPRIVMAHLSSELGVTKDDFPIKSLRSWLVNYRKKNSAVFVADQSGRVKENTTINSYKAKPLFTDDNNSVSGKKFDF